MRLGAAAGFGSWGAARGLRTKRCRALLGPQRCGAGWGLSPLCSPGGTGHCSGACELGTGDARGPCQRELLGLLCPPERGVTFGLSGAGSASAGCCPFPLAPAAAALGAAVWPGRFPHCQSCGMAFASCPGPALALSRLAVTLCRAWARLVLSPMLWNLLVEALGLLFLFLVFWHHLSLLELQLWATLGMFLVPEQLVCTGGVEEVCVQCQVILLLHNLAVQRDVTCPFLAKFHLFFLSHKPVGYLQVVLVAEACRHARAHPALGHTFAFLKCKSTLGSSFVLLF